SPTRHQASLDWFAGAHRRLSPSRVGNARRSMAKVRPDHNDARWGRVVLCKGPPSVIESDLARAATRSRRDEVEAFRKEAEEQLADVARALSRAGGGEP